VRLISKSDITSDLFYNVVDFLVKSGCDSDKSSFTEIRENLNYPKVLSPDKFAEEVFYVICTSGFNQKTAKRIFLTIVDYVAKNQCLKYDDMIKIYNNPNKIKAIIKVWHSRETICREFYALTNVDEKLAFLSQLPHVGKITKYHIARNLGLDVVKYDIWVQRLGVALYGTLDDIQKINNSILDARIKALCDEMFFDLALITKEKRGYIDVVLWKACQQKAFVIDKNHVYASEMLFMMSKK